MTAFVALLRAVNVGGGSKLTMADLRATVTGLGHRDVQTYLQSGNAVFTSGDDNPDRVGPMLEQALAERFGLRTQVLLRTAEELADVVAANPYLDHQDDFTKLHVTFLTAAPEPERADVEVPAGETGVLTVRGREVYLHCPDGYGRTKLNNAFLERRLARPGTTRNWKSVVALHDLLHA
ncbi:MAG TPA: DUF1697 domain-containing protein [Kineosporiaceae bacterium]